MNDSLDDGDQSTAVTVTIDDANSDDAFDALADQTVTVTTTDDDDPTLTLSILASSVSEGAGSAATSGTVSRNTDTTDALTVNLSSDDISEATVPSSVTIPAGLSSPSFDIDAVDDAIVDGTVAVSITAQSSGFIDGTDTVDVTDDDTAVLSLDISGSSIVESAGPAATSATVTRNTDTTNPLTVSLSSNDSTEATAPAVLIIPPGQSSATFDIDAVDDAIVDGTQTVTITASSAGHSDGTATVDVTDDDSPALTLSIAADSISENGGTTTATVTRNSDTTNQLIVTLMSNDPSEVAVSGTVTIAAGQSSASFSVNGVDDAIVDGTQTVTITATESGHSTGSDTVDVTDDDTPALTVSITAASISENGGTATATVTRNTDTFSTVVASLSSSDLSEATVPSFVNILSGQTSATFTVTGVDDPLVDGTQTVTITAQNSGFTDGTDTVDVTDDDVAGFSVVETEGSTRVSESGTTDTFTVVLDAQPLSDVRFDVSSGDTGEASVNLSSLIFTSSNWNTAQSVTVTGVDDAVVDGDVLTSVTLSVNDGGSDDAFDPLADQSVSVTTTDNDSAALTLIIAAASVSEGAGASSTPGTVIRNTDTTNALTVNLSTSDISEATVPSSVTIAAGQSSASFDIDAVDDAIVDGTQTVTITGTATGHNTGSDTLDVTDDDTPALTLSISPAAISENGGSATATVTRNTDTSSTVAVSLSSSDLSEATVPSFVNIFPGQTSATFTVTGVDDTLVDGTQTVTITAQNSGFTDGTHTVDVTDDDTNTLTLSIQAASVGEASAQTGTSTIATVSRNGDTTNALTVTLTSSDLSEATVVPTVTIAAGQTSFTFGVDAVDDSILDGTQTVTITASAPGYGSATDTLDVTDDESPALTVSILADSISENGGTTTATVTGNTDPSSSVVASLSSSDVGEATVPSFVNIPAGQTSATFTLTGVDDTLVDGTQTVTITAQNSGFTDGTDTVDVTDDDTPALSLDISGSSIPESTGPAATTGTVTRNTDTTNPLTVSLSSNDTTEATLSALVTIPAGQSFATFNIDAVDDTLLDGTQTVTITASSAGHSDATATLDVSDDESPALSVSIAAASISENGGTTTATVTRNSDTTNQLIVTLMSNDPSEAAVSGSVTIAPGQTSASFSVNGVDDSIVDGTFTVTISALEAGHSTGSDTVDVTDDDTAKLSLAIAASAMSEGAGVAATTGTVSRNTDTTNPLTVSLSSNDTSEAAVPASVTIAGGQSSETFNIDAVDDAIFDGTQTATLTASAAGHADGTDTVDVTDDDATLSAINVNGTEDTTLNFTTVNFSSAYSHPAGTALASVAIQTLPASGVLTLNGATIAVNDLIAAADLGNLSYQPAANENGPKTFTVRGSDGAQSTAPATVTMTLAPVNDPPVFGSSTASHSVPENTTAVTTVSATDVDGGAPSYTLSGGADQSEFTIDGGSGALAFKSAPDFENPTDATSDNIYEVQVRASDGTNFGFQDLQVSVTDVVEGSTRAELVSGDLVITDIKPGGEADEILLSTDGSVITAINNKGLGFVIGAGVTKVTDKQVTVPLSSVTGKIIVNALGGNDSLTVDFSAGGTFKAIDYQGGDPTTASGDSLALKGGATFAMVTHRFTDASSGSVDITGHQTISYSGLEPIQDELTVTGRVFRFEAAAAETVVLSDDGASGNGQSRIDSGQAEQVTFKNPSGSLTIETTAASPSGAQIIRLDSLDSGFGADLTVKGAAGDLVQVVSQTIALGIGELDIQTGPSEVQISKDISGAGMTFDAPVKFTGGASVTLTGGGTIDFKKAVTDQATLTVRAPLVRIGAAWQGPSSGAAYLWERTGGMTLDVAGTVTGGRDFTMGNASVLTGTGSVSVSVLMKNGSTVAPGASAGVLLTGDLTFESGSTFDTEIGGSAAGASGHDQLDVTGAVDLGGGNATLTLTGLPGLSLKTNDELVLIKNDGTDAVTSAFNGLPEGHLFSNFLGSGLNATITYAGGADSNDVVISVGSATSPPTLSAIAVPGTEDTMLAFSATDFTGAYSHPAGAALASVAIQSLPASGTLTLNGAALSVNDVIAAADLGKLSYAPAANENGPKTFTVTASDGALSSTPATTVTMNLAPVNDAPSFALPAIPNLWAWGFNGLGQLGDESTVDKHEPTQIGDKKWQLVSAGEVHTVGLRQGLFLVSALAGGGQQNVEGFAREIEDGDGETDQGVSFIVTTDNNELFAGAEGRPAISAGGKLTFTPVQNQGGTTTVTVKVKVDGGADNGGLDTSAELTFRITVRQVTGGNPQLANGRGQDGLIADGTVFFDANFNGQLDGAEPSTTTDSAGFFSMNVPLATFDTNTNGTLDPAEGRLVLQGGTDIATGLPNTTQMFAPPGSTVINPLTTLVTGVLAANPALTSDQAQATVKTSLGIGGNVDLRTFDMFAEAAVNNPDASGVLNAAAKVQDTVLQVSSVVSGKTGSTQQNAVDSAVGALVNKISAGQAVDLTDSTELKMILSEASGNSLSSAELDVSTEIIKASNDKKQEAFNQGGAPLALAADLVKVQLIAQGEASADLMKVAQGTLDQDEALNRHTGSGLDVSVNAAPVGDLTGGEIRNGAFSFKLANFSVKEDGTDAVAVTVVRDNGNMGAVDVIVTPSAGTAGAADFNATPITVSFADKQISQNVSMSGIVIDDNIGGESNEAINLTLSLANGARGGASIGGIAVASLGIVDNDSAGTFAFSAGQFTVTESGTGVVPVTIERTGGSFGSVNLVVTASAIAGGATAGVDFGTTPTTVSFAEGNLSRRVDVPVIDDNDLEPDETLTLTLTLAPGSSGSVVGQTSAVLTIQNDDVAKTATAPTITAIAPQTVIEDGILTGINFTIADDQSTAAQLSTTATSSNPSLVPNINISINGAGLTRSIGLTPVANGIGSTTITVTVSDGNESSSTSFNVIVHPVNDLPTISQIAYQQINANGFLNQLTFTVADEESHVSRLTLSVTSSNSTLFPSSGLMITGSGASRSLSIRPASDLSGAGDIIIRANDGFALTEMTFRVVVTPVNDPPTILPLDDIEVFSGAGVILLDYQIVDQDSPFDALRITFRSLNPSLIPTSAFESVGTGYRRNLRVRTPDSGFGIANVLMFVQDEFSSTSRSFRITVLEAALPANRLTLDAINNVEITEDASIRIPVSIGVTGTPVGPLSYTMKSDQESLLRSGTVSVEGEAGQQSFELSPRLNQSGRAVVTFSVTDGQNAASRSFQLSVLPVNDLPSISEMDPIRHSEGTRTSVGFTISDVDTPLENLRLTIESLDEALLPTGSFGIEGEDGNHRLVIEPPVGLVGEGALLIRVSDGEGQSEQRVSVTVLSVDEPPFLSVIDPIEMVEDTEATIEFSFGDPDTVSSALKLEVHSSNENLFPIEGLNIRGEAPSGRLSIRPAADGEGTGSVEIVVSDGVSSVKREVHVSVQGTNDGPTISALKDIVINENEEKVITIEIADPDSPLERLIVAATSSNPSLIPSETILVTGVGAQRKLTLSPVEGQQGKATIFVGVSDGDEVASSKFDVVVVGPDTALPTESNLKIYISLSGLVIEWEGEGILQSATNVEGPYSSVPWAKSPLIVSHPKDGERYFRVIAP